MVGVFGFYPTAAAAAAAEKSNFGDEQLAASADVFV